MLDAPMKAARTLRPWLRLDQRARCSEEVMLDVDVEKKMAGTVNRTATYRAQRVPYRYTYSPVYACSKTKNIHFIFAIGI